MDEEKEKEELSNKELRFCEEYVVDWNGARAARVAGYSEKTAKEQASRMLTKVNVKDHIQEIKDNLSLLSGVTALRNIKELAKVAYTNVSDFKEDWFKFKRFEDLTEDQKAAIAEITHSELNIGEDMVKVVEKLKVHDKLKAIAMLNKMFGYDIVEPEKEESNTGSLTINIGTNGIKELPSHEDDIIDFTENE
jgi:phage terminase small subunit